MMGNMCTNVSVKFNYDWLHIDKALGNFRTSDNNNNNNNVVSASKNCSNVIPAHLKRVATLPCKPSQSYDAWLNSSSYTQYTPPTRLNCQVASRRRCVLGCIPLLHDEAITSTSYSTADTTLRHCQYIECDRDMICVFHQHDDELHDSWTSLHFVTWCRVFCAVHGGGVGDMIWASFHIQAAYGTFIPRLESPFYVM